MSDEGTSVKGWEWKTAEVRLPYNARGDDLAWYLEEEDLPLEYALEAQAADLDGAASMLRRLRHRMAGMPVDIHADRDRIWLKGPADWIDQLLIDGLVLIRDDEDGEVDDLEEGELAHREDAAPSLCLEHRRCRCCHRRLNQPHGG